MSRFSPGILAVMLIAAGCTPALPGKPGASPGTASRSGDYAHEMQQLHAENSDAQLQYRRTLQVVKTIDLPGEAKGVAMVANGRVSVLCDQPRPGGSWLSLWRTVNENDMLSGTGAIGIGSVGLGLAPNGSTMALTKRSATAVPFGVSVVDSQLKNSTLTLKLADGEPAWNALEVVMAIGPDSRMVLAEAGGGRYWRIDTDGTMRRIAGPGVDARSMTIGTDGSLWVLDYEKTLRRYPQDGDGWSTTADATWASGAPFVDGPRETARFREPSAVLRLDGEIVVVDGRVLRVVDVDQSVSSIRLQANDDVAIDPIVGLAATPDGKGVWLAMGHPQLAGHLVSTEWR